MKNSTIERNEGENAWSKDSSTEVFNAVPHNNKEMHVIPEV